MTPLAIAGTPKPLSTLECHSCLPSPTRHARNWSPGFPLQTTVPSVTSDPSPGPGESHIRVPSLVRTACNSEEPPLPGPSLELRIYRTPLATTGSEEQSAVELQSTVPSLPFSDTKVPGSLTEYIWLPAAT